MEEVCEEDKLSKVGLPVEGTRRPPPGTPQAPPVFAQHNARLPALYPVSAERSVDLENISPPDRSISSFIFLSSWSPVPSFSRQVVNLEACCIVVVLESSFPIVLDVFSLTLNLSFPESQASSFLVFEAHIVQCLHDKLYTVDKHFACLNWPALRLDGQFVWVRKSKLKTIFLRILKVLFHCPLIFKLPLKSPMLFCLSVLYM